jgi:hypothetical protein
MCRADQVFDKGANRVPTDEPALWPDKKLKQVGDGQTEVLNEALPGRYGAYASERTDSGGQQIGAGAIQIGDNRCVEDVAGLLMSAARLRSGL